MFCAKYHPSYLALTSRNSQLYWIHSCVTNVYPVPKSANYRIRVEPELHQEFLDVCKAEDRPAAQVVREFMRNHVKKYRFASQADLFVAEQRQRYQSGGNQEGNQDE